MRKTTLKGLNEVAKMNGLPGTTKYQFNVVKSELRNLWTEIEKLFKR